MPQITVIDLQNELLKIVVPCQYSWNCANGGLSNKLPKMAYFWGHNPEFLSFQIFPREFPALAGAGDVDPPNMWVWWTCSGQFLIFGKKNGQIAPKWPNVGHFGVLSEYGGVTPNIWIAYVTHTMKPFEGPLQTRTRRIARLSGIGRRRLCSGQDFRYRPAVAGVDFGWKNRQLRWLLFTIYVSLYPVIKPARLIGLDSWLNFGHRGGNYCLLLSLAMFAGCAAAWKCTIS